MRRLALMLLVGASACGFHGGGAGADAGSGSGSGAHDDATADRDATIGSDALVELGSDAFAVAQCPITYHPVTGAPATSYYRLVDDTAMNFWDRAADCRDDLQGATHLVVLDAPGEAAVLAAKVTGSANLGRYFVGVIQQGGQATPSAGWIDLFGVAVPAAQWGVYQGLYAQPDDGTDANESDHAENAAVMVTNAGDAAIGSLLDVTGAIHYGAICECDGNAVASAATTAIDDDPNNPN